MVIAVRKVFAAAIKEISKINFIHNGAKQQ